MIEDDVDAILRQQSLADDHVRRSGGDLITTLCDLGELVRASVPLPTPSADGDDEFDTVVDVVLDLLYECRQTSAECVVERIETDRWSAALNAGRLLEIDSTVVVPLEAQGPAIRNWPLVFDFVDEKLSIVLKKSRRLLRRLEQNHHGTVRQRVWTTVVDMIEDTRTVLQHTVARQRWLTHLADRSDEQPESFGEWVIERLEADQ